jgi:hypothetical protein
MRQDELQPKSRGARVGALKERWDPFSRRRVMQLDFGVHGDYLRAADGL